MANDLNNFQSKILHHAGGRIAYQVSGNGPAVVLLHGLSGSSRWWVRNAPFLARHFRVYVVDLIGFGRSRGQRFALLESPNLILEWMDSVDERSFSLIGHSMGGYVAASIAAADPGRIDSLVLVDGVVQPLGWPVLRSAWGLIEALPYMPPDFYPVLGTDALRAGPVTLLRAIQDIHRLDLVIDLSRISAQTLVIWGEHDRLIPLEFGKKLHQALPGSSLAVLPGAGHVAMWDRAEDFNRLVLEFLLRIHPA